MLPFPFKELNEQIHPTRIEGEIQQLKAFPQQNSSMISLNDSKTNYEINSIFKFKEYWLSITDSILRIYESRNDYYE